MPNPYSYTGPGERWVEGDPTAEDYLNVSRINADYLYEALSTIMDTDAADGIVTGAMSGTIDMRFSGGLKFINATANKAATLFWRNSDDLLVGKIATGTQTPPTPSTEDDYDTVVAEMASQDPTGPTF